MNDLPNDDPAEDGPSSDEPLTNGLPHYESFPFPGPEIHAVPGEVHDEASMIAGETMDQVGAVVGDSAAATPPKTGEDTGRSAFLVGAGILISRIVGLVRQRVFAHYFGLSAAGDAFSAAFRIPNFLQNIFGEARYPHRLYLSMQSCWRTTMKKKQLASLTQYWVCLP